MKQAQLDPQTQFPQNRTDLTTQRLFTDSLVLFFESIEDSTINPSEQIENHTIFSKDQT